MGFTLVPMHISELYISINKYLHNYVFSFRIELEVELEKRAEASHCFLLLQFLSIQVIICHFGMQKKNEERN